MSRRMSHMSPNEVQAFLDLCQKQGIQATYAGNVFTNDDFQIRHKHLRLRVEAPITSGADRRVYVYDIREGSSNARVLHRIHSADCPAWKGRGWLQALVTAAATADVPSATSSEEEWRPIPGVNGIEISKEGVIRKISTGTLRKPTLRGNHLCISIEGVGGDVEKDKNLTVASLVLEVWGGMPRPDGYSPSYKDGNPRNTHISNLEWAPRSKKSILPTIAPLAVNSTPVAPSPTPTPVEQEHTIREDRYTEEEARQCILLWGEGKTLTEIAQTIGRTSEYARRNVTRCIRGLRFGESRVPNETVFPGLDPLRKESVRQRYARGFSITGDFLTFAARMGFFPDVKTRVVPLQKDPGWRTVPNFPVVDVTVQGEVRTTDTKKPRKPSLSKHGRLTIHIRIDGATYTRCVAELVLAAWGDQERPPGARHITYKDGNPLNLHLSNLEWAG